MPVLWRSTATKAPSVPCSARAPSWPATRFPSPSNRMIPRKDEGGGLTMKFSYTSGQKPLEGYILKRGIGRGGFGEVYFAMSDGGKEVALKLLRGSGPRDVELRGVVQCLNLKHPNLVAL